MGMTAKRQQFCEEYLRNGFNATQAYFTVYQGKAKKPAYPFILLKDPEVAAYIKERRDMMYEAQNIDAMRVMEALSNIAFGETNEANTTANKLRALEILSKNLSLQTQKIETQDTIEVNVVE